MTGLLEPAWRRSSTRSTTPGSRTACWCFPLILATSSGLSTRATGVLGYWQHPYLDRFQGPLKIQKQLLLQARARLTAQQPVAKAAQDQPDQEDVVSLPESDRTVFVIHGRDKKARREFFTFLRALRLEPIEWAKGLAETRQGAPKIGDVLQKVLSKGRAVIVLSTPDDVVRLNSEHADDEHDLELQPMGQARPNVIYETGMAMMLIPERTILVEVGKVRRFTDLDGHFVVQLTNDAKPRKFLAQRLKDIGCPVDLDGSDWLEAGDLTPPDQPRTLSYAAAVATDDDGIVLDIFTVKPDHTVHGEAHNGGAVKKTIALTATFYDVDRKILGTAAGIVNGLAPGQTKTFTLSTLDDVAGYQDFKVQVDAAF